MLGPGWGGFFISMLFSSLMRIDTIYIVHVAGFEPRGDPPVVINRNTLQPYSVSSGWMQSVPWHFEIAGLVGDIQVGAVADVHLPALPGRTMPGAVSHISPIANGHPSSVTYGVRIEI